MYMATKTASAATQEKPQNGLAGLKHWRHDIVAGLLVSLISLPFSLGIAIASGAPPIAGLVSAIIAGLLLPFLGGAYVTISGPAAGLAPVLLASMMALGHGNLQVGYPLLLCVIAMAGCVQIVLSLLKAARFSALFPSSVVEGMLASIGLLIIAKQLPNFIGRPFEAHDFFEILREAPSQFAQLNAHVFFIGLATLALIFALSVGKAPWLKFLPPQVLAVVFATLAGWATGLDRAYLIHIPDHPLEHGFALPNFAELAASPALWGIAITTVVTLTLIDGVESLATALAVDKIDPFRRKSDPNRVLLAMGISNICSSLVGGLTIIPGGVKSKACIVGGGRTLWANFYNAIFLLLFLFVARDLINQIPLSALAAVLIFTGYKLCEPRIWKHVAHIGREQLLLFSATVLMTLCTDLLWGIAFGMAVKLLVNLWFSSSLGQKGWSANGLAAAMPLPRISHVARQFRNPVARRVHQASAYHIYFEGPLVCFNNLQVHRELRRIPSDVTDIYLHLYGAPLIDHTSCEKLFDFLEESASDGRVRCELVGIDRMRRRSHFASCMRLAAQAGHGPLSEVPVAVATLRDASTDGELVSASHAARSGEPHGPALPKTAPQWSTAIAPDEENWCVDAQDRPNGETASLSAILPPSAPAALPATNGEPSMTRSSVKNAGDLGRMSLCSSDGVHVTGPATYDMRGMALLPKHGPRDPRQELSQFGLLRRNW